MPVPSAPSLLLGLSLRIFIDKFISPQEESMRDFGLLGLWQGVAVYYAFTISQELAGLVALLIVIKLLLEFNTEQDPVKFVATVFGTVLGVFGTDLLSRYLGDGLYRKKLERKAVKSSSHPHRDGNVVVAERRQQRSVHFHKTGAAAPPGGVVSVGAGMNNSRERPHRRAGATSRISPSDITSIDNSSDMFRSSSLSSMSPLEREVARLRTRASLADTERRRYKEERKWALSQGNHALASQMTWEVKRYKALMQSFHKEADALVIQASNSRKNGTDGQHPPTPDRNHKPNGTAVASSPITTNSPTTSQQNKQKPGPSSKPAVRTARW